MQKSRFIRAVQEELRRHSPSYFATNDTAVPTECDGAVRFVPGCAACRKVMHTNKEFMDHLTNDVLPALLNRLLESKPEKAEGGELQG